MTRRLLTPALALAAALLAPASARAADALVIPPPPCHGTQAKYMQCDPPIVRYTAQPGEANRLTISPGEAGAVRFQDVAVTVHAGSGCSTVDEHTVSCGSGGPVRTDVGDLDDVVDAVGVIVDLGRGGSLVQGGPGDDRITGAANAAGGPGNDTLSATPERTLTQLSGDEGDDVLTGAGGSDSLVGGDGRDTLIGGPGDDLLTGDGGPTVAADAIDGGEGSDVVDYADRRAGITVDLTRPESAGAAGEGDRLAGIEHVNGGRGPDRLTGDAGDNVLAGARGADVIDGGPGDDNVEGGRGRDRLEGGDGDDALEAGTERCCAYALRVVPGAPLIRDDGDRVSCGAGRDRVEGRNDVLAPDCERLGPSAAVPLIAPHPVRARRRALTFFVSCPRIARQRGRCRGSLSAGTGRARFSLGAGGGRVTVRGRHLSGRVPVRVVLRRRGSTQGARYLIVLPRRA